MFSLPVLNLCIGVLSVCFSVGTLIFLFIYLRRVPYLNFVATLDPRELSDIGHAVVTIAVDGTMLKVSPMACLMFGYNREEMVGNKVTMLMPDDQAKQHDSAVKSYLETGIKRVIGIRREVVAKRKDGTTFPMRLAVSEVWSSDSSVRIFVGICTDISAEKWGELKRGDRTSLRRDTP